MWSFNYFVFNWRWQTLGPIGSHTIQAGITTVIVLKIWKHFMERLAGHCVRHPELAVWAPSSFGTHQWKQEQGQEETNIRRSAEQGRTKKQLSLGRWCWDRDAWKAIDQRFPMVSAEDNLSLNYYCYMEKVFPTSGFLQRLCWQDEWTFISSQKGQVVNRLLLVKAFLIRACIWRISHK